MWIGADWDSLKCVVAYERGGRVRTAEVKRSPGAVEAFLQRLDGVDVKVGIESGDPLWAKLWRRAGATAFVFDGKKARRFSESLCASGARDDRRSAEDLLSMVQSPSHRSAANAPALPGLTGVERLQKACDTSKRDAVRQQTRLLSQLRQYHPALALQLAKRLQTVWALNALMVAPTAAAWAELDEGTQEKTLVGSRLSSRPGLLRAFGEDWGAVDSEEEAATRFLIRSQVQALQGDLQRSKEAWKALNDALAQSSVAQLVLSMKGIGAFLAAGVAVAAGVDPSRAGRDGIAMKLGAAPVTARSGKLGDANPRVSMRRSADRVLRKSGYLIGLQLVKNHAWAKAQFDYHRSRGKRTADACRRIVRSFSRIVFALNRDGASFDEARYIKQLQAKGVVWAMELVPPC